MIKNQYAGKTPEQVWDQWSLDQRVHFFKDHNISFPSVVDLDIRYNSLSPDKKNAIERHLLQGQYAKGGKVSEYEYYVYEDGNWRKASKADFKYWYDNFASEVMDRLGKTYKKGEISFDKVENIYNAQGSMVAEKISKMANGGKIKRKAKKVGYKPKMHDKVKFNAGQEGILEGEIWGGYKVEGLKVYTIQTNPSIKFDDPNADDKGSFYDVTEKDIIEKLADGGITSTKARKILHDKEIRGHALTEKQRKFFGARASGYPYKKWKGGETYAIGGKISREIPELKNKRISAIWDVDNNKFDLFVDNKKAQTFHLSDSEDTWNEVNLFGKVYDLNTYILDESEYEGNMPTFEKWFSATLYPVIEDGKYLITDTLSPHSIDKLKVINYDKLQRFYNAYDQEYKQGGIIQKAHNILTKRISINQLFDF